MPNKKSWNGPYPIHGVERESVCVCEGGRERLQEKERYYWPSLTTGGDYWTAGKEQHALSDKEERGEEKRRDGEKRSGREGVFWSISSFGYSAVLSATAVFLRIALSAPLLSRSPVGVPCAAAATATTALHGAQRSDC